MEIEVVDALQWNPPADSEEEEDDKRRKYKSTGKNAVRCRPPDGLYDSPSDSDTDWAKNSSS